MTQPIQFQLSVQDTEASPEELQLILQTLAAELENQSAQVNSIVSSEGITPEMLTKGGTSGSLLDVKIDLNALTSFGSIAAAPASRIPLPA